MIQEIEKLLQKYQEQLTKSEAIDKEPASVWEKLQAQHQIPILRSIVSDLIILQANYVSSDAKVAREYLEYEGIDVDKVVKEGMERINKMKGEQKP